MNIIPPDAIDWLVRGFFMTFGIALAYLILFLLMGKGKKGLKRKINNFFK